MYGVWCVVSGGVTGHREAWLKVEGEEYRTEFYDAAREMADNLNEQMNGPYATASFSYSVRNMD